MIQNKISAEFKHVIVSSSDKKLGLNINTVGYRSIKTKKNSSLNNQFWGNFVTNTNSRIMYEYQLIYITKGKGTLSFNNDKEYSISKGNLFIIYPGQRHIYKPLLGTGWNGYYIRFEGAIMDTIVANSFLPNNNQVFDVGMREELVGHFIRAIEIADKDEKSAQLSLSGVVMSILGLVVSMTQNNVLDKNDPVLKIEQAKVFMAENVYSIIDVKRVAMDVNMGYSCFRKVFKEYTGNSPLNYYNELKIKKAQQLLESTSYQTKDISYILGFNSTEYFSTYFKKKTGYTPLEYRQYARGKAG